MHFEAKNVIVVPWVIKRRVVTDAQAPYFGAVVDDNSLAPEENATIFTSRYSDWINAENDWIPVEINNDGGAGYSFAVDS
jgi:hypothetical protein